jgi:glycosyltransferase involved in cell wall biosynthesis
LIKIISIITTGIGSGGGFDQALNAIVQMQRLCVNRFNFEVFTTVERNVELLNQLGVKATAIKIALFDKLLAKFSQNSIWQRFQVHVKIIGPLEKKLVECGCDVVYFVAPGNLSAGLQKLNYITTVWDLCYRETPDFPEVRNFNTFFIRENNYQHNLGPALFTLTDSQRLADMASHYFGIERNRFIAMPFAPSPFLEKTHAITARDVLKKHILEANYFFYPAQFWAHKNHIRILQAIQILRDDHGWKPNVVFSGKDYGNLEHIKKFIIASKLESQVKILGFVPSEEMRGLYENAIAVVMPTYFGPTNLPPLEAWSLGIPLIYSAHLSEQTGNAALLVDPDNSQELAEAMLLCTKSDVRRQLISNGHQQLENIDLKRKIAESEFCAILAKFTARRQCWE